MPDTRELWNERAAAAEAAVLDRFVRRVGPVAWGRSAWPPRPLLPLGPGGARADWHYWWSAHLVDAAVDAAGHRPGAARARRPRALLRGIPVLNPGWSRSFWDDLAWVGLALDGAGRHRHAARIAARLEGAVDAEVGAIPWRVGSRLFNAPANGPAAVLLARTGRVEAAGRLTDWLHATLVDPGTGLVLDGVEVEATGAHPVTDLYTYCQGVVLGADLALGRHAPAAALVEAIARWTAPSGVLPGRGGGDGGLFAGITARYLALAARRLDGDAAAGARSVVLASADAAWAGAVAVGGHPLFSADWRRPADPSPTAPERDLSVQLGAWLALEAAVEVS